MEMNQDAARVMHQEECDGRRLLPLASEQGD
jgi:hypothetical protein